MCPSHDGERWERNRKRDRRVVSGKRDSELKDRKALLIGSKAQRCEGNRAEQVRARCEVHLWDWL